MMPLAPFPNLTLTLARLSAWAVFPVAEVAILGFTRVSYPGMGNLEEGKLASAQQNVEMPRRCYAQAISFLPGKKGSRFQIKSPGPGPARVPGPAQGRKRQRQRQRQRQISGSKTQAVPWTTATTTTVQAQQNVPTESTGRYMWTTATIITNSYRSSSTSDAWTIRSNLPNPGCRFSNAC